MSATGYSLTTLVRDVDATFVASSPGTFWTCKSFVERFVGEGGLHAAINDHLTQLKRDPHHAGDWGAQEIYLHRTNIWSLSLAVLDAPRRFIHALSEFAYYVPLQKTGLRAHRYSLPPDFRNDVFDPGVRIEKAGLVQTSAGKALALESERYAYDFEISMPVPVLRLTTAPLRPLEWLFSKATLQAWQANDADIASTQLRVAAYVLGKIAHQSSVVPLKQLSSHRHHAVRWAAIQNLGRLNRSEALVKIREATNDPHPHVRRAAQKTLEQIEKKSKG